VKEELRHRDEDMTNKRWVLEYFHTDRRQDYECSVVGGKGVHIDSFGALDGPKSHRKMLGTPVVDTSFVGVVPVEAAHGRVVYPTREQGMKKKD
jgi:hypothetical protein